GMLRDQTDHVHIWSLGENLPSDWVGLSLTALIGVLWSFGGWHHATYLAGETRHPQRNVPRAMLIGALVVTLTYVLTNLAYLWLLPLETIAGTERVAGDALEAVMSGGGKAVALLIGVSVFGTIAIYTMSAPRIYFAMARDGVFFGFLARLHSKFKTPANAMATQALWAIFLLLIWGHFHDLITYVTFIDVAFMTLAGIGIFIFRIQRADVSRPYRAWGYPVIPGLYVLITFAFLVNTFIERPEQTKAGLAVLAAGVVVYFLIKHFRKDTSSE
ncbi:MAG: amino acid permease, partial [Bacteroidota bacterium]